MNYRNYLDNAFLMANKVLDIGDERFPEVFLATNGRSDEKYFHGGLPTWRKVVPSVGASGASSSAVPSCEKKLLLLYLPPLLLLRSSRPLRGMVKGLCHHGRHLR